MATEWKKPLQWDNAGSEPSDTLKTEGFKAGYKPPAELFNYFLHRAYECFLQLQQEADNHADDKENPHGVTAAQIGAAAENHKHPYSINIGYDRTDIANGADLNDILDMGCYRCATATKASTLKNCPTKNAFIMDMVASTGGNATIDPKTYSYGTQRIYALGGREYVRQVISNGDGTITYGEWITMYSTLDKPTPTDLGAANREFSNLLDRAMALKNLHATDNFKGKVNGIELSFDAAITQGEYSVAGIDMTNAPYEGNIYGKLIVIVSDGGTHDNASNWVWQVFYSTLLGRIYFRSKVNDGEWSTWAGIYNKNNKPTAEDVGALSTSGGGTVAADNIRPIVVKNTADNACYTRFDGKDGILGFLGFAKEGNVRALTKDGAVLGDIYHTGNKPSAADIGAAASSHTQGANTITAGTFAGTVYANRDSGGQEPSYYLVRNSKLATAEENPTTNGEICWTYE